MNIQTIWPVAAAMLLGGCAHLEHQTAEAEPHAVLSISSGMESDIEHRLVKRVDGLPVSGDREYRIRPGLHEIVVRVVERTSETIRPYSFGVGSHGPYRGPVNGSANIDISESGRVSVTGRNPLGGAEMANVTVAGRSVSYFTNTISAEAGWRYEFDGYDVKKVRLPK